MHTDFYLLVKFMVLLSKSSTHLANKCQFHFILFFFRCIRCLFATISHSMIHTYLATGEKSVHFSAHFISLRPSYNAKKKRTPIFAQSSFLMNITLLSARIRFLIKILRVNLLRSYLYCCFVSEGKMSDKKKSCCCRAIKKKCQK